MIGQGFQLRHNQSNTAFTFKCKCRIASREFDVHRITKVESEGGNESAKTYKDYKLFLDQFDIIFDAVPRCKVQGNKHYCE